MLSCCPCEGRISGIVDSPNAVATLAIPIAIFDQVCYIIFELRNIYNIVIIDTWLMVQIDHQIIVFGSFFWAFVELIGLFALV